jgi:hypothetical protein
LQSPNVRQVHCRSNRRQCICSCKGTCSTRSKLQRFLFEASLLCVQWSLACSPVLNGLSRYCLHWCLRLSRLRNVDTFDGTVLRCLKLARFLIVSRVSLASSRRHWPAYCSGNRCSMGSRSLVAKCTGVCSLLHTPSSLPPPLHRIPLNLPPSLSLTPPSPSTPPAS